MARAAILLADGFETVEALATADVLRRAGVRCELVSCMGTTHLISGQLVQVLADTTLEALLEAGDDASPDCLVVPGGMPAVKLLASNAVVCDLVARALRDGETLVAAICAGPVLLAQAGLPQGARVAVSPAYADQVPPEARGDEALAVQERLVTARSMGCVLEFALTLVERLAGPDALKRCKATVGLSRPEEA